METLKEIKDQLKSGKVPVYQDPLDQMVTTMELMKENLGHMLNVMTPVIQASSDALKRQREITPQTDDTRRNQVNLFTVITTLNNLRDQVLGIPIYLEGLCNTISDLKQNKVEFELVIEEPLATSTPKENTEKKLTEEKQKTENK